MAPPHTCSNPQTPRKPRHRQGDYSTQRRFRFFLAHEERAGIATFASICEDVEISTPCGCKWLRQREQLGDLAWHKTRKLSDKLGGPTKVSKECIKALVNLDENPVRDQPLEAQIEWFQLPLGP